MDTEKLFALAREAAKASYSPYSRFPVGAALLCADGSIFTGANVENRSFGLTNCAERSAVFAAVSAGKRDFVGIVIATPSSDYPVGPCGACRQVLSEFMGPEAPVVFGPSYEKRVESSVGELYPYDSLHELAKDRR